MPASGKRKIKSASTCFDRMSAKLKAFGGMASNGLSPVVAYAGKTLDNLADNYDDVSKWWARGWYGE